MRTSPRALLPAGILAAAIVATACVPPLPDPPPGETTSTTTGRAPRRAPARRPRRPRPRPSTTTTSTTTTIAQPPTTVPDGTGLYSPTPVDGWGIAKNAANDQYIDAVEIAGGAVYAGGRFDQAKRNSQTATRANLMAVELSSGALLPFVADTNGTVNAIASDGSSLYIGGTFTTVNGVARNRLAKLDLATGAVDTSFTAGAGNIVHDMVVVGSRLYIVGEFNTVNGVERHRAAAVNTSNGELDATFDPNASSKVQAIAASPDGATIYLGGNFATMGGVARANLAAVDGVTGALKSPAFKQVNDLVEDLAVSPDGSHLYAGTRFNSAVDWDTANGNREWLARADGDMQAVVYSNHMVYGGFHDGFESNISLRLLALDPDDGVPDATFRPASNGYPGVYCLDANGAYLVAGGYFSTMGGVGVEGLAIFPKA